MAGEQPGTVTIKGARIIFRNFEGKEGQYNQAGARNFGVILPEDIASVMLEDGWNVKRLKPSEEEKEQGLEQGPPWLPVKVAYDKGAPPKIMVVSSEGRKIMAEDEVETLDWAEIAIDRETNQPKVDIIVRPYSYEVHGRSGISAYLKTMLVTIVEDELEIEFARMAREQDEARVEA